MNNRLLVVVRKGCRNRDIKMQICWIRGIRYVGYSCLELTGSTGMEKRDYKESLACGTHLIKSWMWQVQFSSVAQSCPTLCDPMDWGTPGFPAHHQLPELAQTCPLSPWCHPNISSFVVPFSYHLQSFPASGSFPMSQFFALGGQSIGASASASDLSMQLELVLIKTVIEWTDDNDFLSDTKVKGIRQVEQIWKRSGRQKEKHKWELTLNLKKKNLEKWLVLTSSFPSVP